MTKCGTRRRARFILAALLALAGTPVAHSEMFVADFNSDGKPDVLMSSTAAPNGFVVLLNQGEWDGKITFRKSFPEVQAAMPSEMTKADRMPMSENRPASSWPAGSASATNEAAAWMPPAAEEQMSSQREWTPPPAATPAPAPVKPSLMPPPAPALASTPPKLKSTAAPKMTAPQPTPKPRNPDREWTPPAAAPQKSAPAASMGAPRMTALFNYRDKTAGAQFAWLERGISNILKFDVLEVKSMQMVDRERTDVTFDPAWFRDSGLQANIIITGEFVEAGSLLKVTTVFLSPSMQKIREFSVDGDRADIFSLIERVGMRLKQELSAL